MRYPQGGGLTAERQQFREELRLQAAERFAQGDASSMIAKDLRVSEPFPTSDGQGGRGDRTEFRWPSQRALARMTAVSEPSGIQVADYDPSWPRQAATAIDALRTAAPELFVEIEHIGSTAVPGLAAKPVIDLMAAVHDLTHAAPHQAALADLGFHPHDNGMTDRVLYVRADNGVRSHILHVVTLESWPTRNQRIFRDYLRAHPEDATRYAQLKWAIVAAGTGAGEYSRAKTALVQELTDRARAHLGLPSVPVWEKR